MAFAEHDVHQQHPAIAPFPGDDRRVHAGPVGDTLDREVVNAPEEEFVERSGQDHLSLRRSRIVHAAQSCVWIAHRLSNYFPYETTDLSPMICDTVKNNH